MGAVFTGQYNHGDIANNTGQNPKSILPCTNVTEQGAPAKGKEGSVSANASTYLTGQMFYQPGFWLDFFSKNKT